MKSGEEHGEARNYTDCLKLIRENPRVPRHPRLKETCSRIFGQVKKALRSDYRLLYRDINLGQQLFGHRIGRIVQIAFGAGLIS